MDDLSDTDRAQIRQAVTASPPCCSVRSDAARDTRLAFPLDHTATLVAGMVQGATPPQLQALINSVGAGCGLHLYIPN